MEVVEAANIRIQSKDNYKFSIEKLANCSI